jgi:cathepsin A (carboxypeptidase C)
MAENLPRCIEVAGVCYSHPDPAICRVAEDVCWYGVVQWYDGESGKGGRNRFDITAPCDIDDFCYKSTNDVQHYLNLPHVQRALHIEPWMPSYRNYSISSNAVADAFQTTNDLGISTEPQVRYLLAKQIDVLFYQGNLDLACNTAGNIRWANSMRWKGEAEFASKHLKPWGEGNQKDKPAGTAKEVKVRMGAEGDEKKTRLAFVTIDGSGHMVPQDQPKVALDLLRRWLAGKEFN